MPKSRPRKKKVIEVPPKKSLAEIQSVAHDITLRAYQKQMAEISNRTSAIAMLLTKARTTGYKATDYESMALNFRKISELIIFASLAGHEKDYASLYPKYKKEWRIKDIMVKLKAINERYYPDPVKDGPEEEYGVRQWLPIPRSEWLSEEELVDMYNICSSLIHAQQSNASEVDYGQYDSRFLEWHNKIVTLLSSHVIVIKKYKFSIHCSMRTTESSVPVVWIFGEVTTESSEILRKYKDAKKGGYPFNLGIFKE